MKNAKKIFSFIFGFVFILCLFFGVAWIRTLDQSNDYRRQLDAARGQLSTATETNSRLAEELGDAQSRLEQCANITEELGDITSRNITTIGECIDLLEKIRESVGSMEVALGLFDSDGYYNWLDNYIFSDGEINERH